MEAGVLKSPIRAIILELLGDGIERTVREIRAECGAEPGVSIHRTLEAIAADMALNREPHPLTRRRIGVRFYYRVEGVEVAAPVQPNDRHWRAVAIESGMTVEAARAAIESAKIT